MRLTARAPGKVNLCLSLGGLRDDGRHELVTLFESVSLADELELTVIEGDDQVVCEGVDEPNLVTTALSRLRARGWAAAPVLVRIEKRIPVAGGMGGGSADAAAMLRLAVQLALGRPHEIAELAAELGSDVPSQLVPGVTLGTGAGELIEPYEPLAEHALVILPQAARLSTAEVYAEADRLGLARPYAELEARYQELLSLLSPGAALPPELIVNDLQPAAISLCPQVEDALAAVRGAGADQALVCGSGPTVAGLFWGADCAERAQAAASALRTQYPGARDAVPVEVEFGSPRFASPPG